MSQLLEFITSFGTSAELRALSKEQLIKVMQDFELSDDEQNAILSGDAARIAEMARTSGDIKCCVVPQEPDDESEEEPADDEETDSLRAAAG